MFASEPYRIMLWDKDGLLAEDTILHPEDWKEVAKIVGFEEV